MKTSDRVNRNSLPYHKNIQQYFPVAAEASYLWLQFIGKTVWQPGAMIYHPQTIYLDLEIVDEGEMFVQYDGKKYHVPPGAAILIPPGESKLAAGSKTGCRKRFMGIVGPVLTNNITSLNLNKVTVLENFCNQEFEELYSKLFIAFTEKESSRIREICALTYQLLLLLSQCAAEEPFPPELQQAVNFLKFNFSRQIDLEDICDAAMCRKTKLQWLFKYHLKTTPIKFLITTRMQYAEKLLKNTDFSIKEIADRCGYADPLYFSHTFFKFYGHSPREYRKKTDL